MNLLVPEHIPQEVRARWAEVDPRVRILPLRIERFEAPARRAVRAGAERWLPYSIYLGMTALLAPRVSYRFSIEGQPLEAARAEIDGFVASWRVSRVCYRTLRPFLPNLKWVHSTRTGVDHLLAPELQKPELRLTCSRGLHSERIAEFVLALIYCDAKRLLEHKALQSAGRWEELKSRDVRGKRALILGTGSLGRAVARRLTDNGVRVTGINRDGRTVEDFEATAATGELADRLTVADFVISTLPLTGATRELLDRPLLERMRAGAMLINVGRDEVVDETALLDLLRDGKISAALEITRPDRIPANHPFNKLGNVLVTHYSSFSGETATAEIYERVEANLRRWLAGEALLGEVDSQAGY